jgi:Neuraminidase (sialidase)
MRKAMRALGLAEKKESAIVKHVESKGCINGAIQAHNQKVLNGTAGHANGHANGAANGVANGATHANTETHPLN